MSGNPPRKPPGPPPTRPRNTFLIYTIIIHTAMDSSGALKSLPPRPSGPPPNTIPIASIKPPPRAPPPALLVQNQQRPPVENLNSRKSNNDDVLSSQPKSANPVNFTAPVKAGGISMFEQSEGSIKKEIQSSPSDKAEAKALVNQSEKISPMKSIPLPRGPPPTSAPPSRENPLVATVSRSNRPAPPTSLSAGNYSS